MYSFYGGKQGRSYKITAHFDSIWDMVQAFNQGGDYTDAQYDEYVIIDTVLRRNLKNNAENGILYRRGYDFNQAFNPHEIPLFPEEPIIDPQTGEITAPTLQPNQLTEVAVDLWVDDYEQEYTYNWNSPKASGNYKVTQKVPKYYDFHYKLHNNPDFPCEIIEREDYFNLERWNDDWEEFVTHPGGGAEYVGQIVGPEGDSPTVEVLEWDEWRRYTQEEGVAEPVRGDVVVDPKPGYDAAAAGQDGYDENGFHDEIQYGYCTIRDLQGNIEGCYLAFDIPYTVFNFEAKSITPYNSKGTYDPETRTWSYQGLIEEDSDSVDHNYYKHYHIDVPVGIHGQNVRDLSIRDYIADGGTWLTYRTDNFDAAAEPETSDYIKLSPYKVITSLQQVYYPSTYEYTDSEGHIQESEYNFPESLILNYTYGNPDVIEYQVIERLWIQSIDHGDLQQDHIYIQMSTGKAVDCGLLKKVVKIAKDEFDSKVYTYYNDGTKTELPIAEIAEMTLAGDLVLVRYKDVEPSFYGSLAYTYDGKTWANLGSAVKGNHVLTNFSSEAALRAAYPYGFGKKPDGSVDPETKERAGWIATVTSQDSYKMYAYDYVAEDWYVIQDLGAAAVKPEYSILVSTEDSQHMPTDPNKNQLQINGIWFVITE